MSTQVFKNSLQNYPKIEHPSAKINDVSFRRINYAGFKPILATVSAIALAASVWFSLPELNSDARIALIVFGLAFIGWTLTEINDTYIALAAAIVISVAGVIDTQKFFASLGDSSIWLLLASFIIAAAVTSTGLANRLANVVVAKVSTVNGLFYGLTAIISATALIIPATSGRAALMLPVYAALCNAITSRRIRIALSILFPAIILLSAVASLTGAAAHLVTVEILAQMTGERITFARWLMFGLPFALVSSFLSTMVILRLFLNQTERASRIEINPETLAEQCNKSKKWSGKEKFVSAVVAVLIGFWMTETLHGISSAMVALLGAMIVTLPSIGTISFKDAVKKINWNLLIFMAATLEMGEALVASGGTKWLVESSFTPLRSLFEANTFAVVVTVAIVSLFAHLFINSRTARSSVLIPVVVVLALSLKLNAAALAFISTTAAGFCLTLTISAKPVMMFSQHDSDTFTQKDLLCLSAVLLPLHLVLLIIFAMFIYPLLGLDFTTVTPVSDLLQNR